MTSIAKLSLLGAKKKKKVPFPGISSPAFTGPATVSWRLHSKNRERVTGTEQTKGS